MMIRLNESFYTRDVLDVAPELLGKILVRRYDDGREEYFEITETEAYRGEEDLACHASKGRTPRTEIMYHRGGYVYVYLIYGMYWMLNVVTGFNDYPQAVLIRGLKGISGPGKVTRRLQIDKSFYGEDLTISNRIWICMPLNNSSFQIETYPRVGIDYAGDYWKSLPWRFVKK
ncbi:MAG: DNA-3-methyladenine glycosylase [Bacteroidales bacterium]|nr:DNA-3-methyladenine glycosylase [Bacteroidales bacterium]